VPVSRSFTGRFGQRAAQVDESTKQEAVPSFLEGFAGELVGGLVALVGVVLGATVGKTLPGLGLSAGIGCLAAGANNIISQGSPPGGVDWAAAGGACLSGALVGAATFGVGRLISNPSAGG
jgi:hypothetical protein